MAIHVNIGVAKTRLSQLVAAALRGENVVLDKDGKPQVRLVALPEAVALENAARAAKRRAAIGFAREKYKAIYDMETDDPDWVIENMFAMRDTPAMPIDPAFNLDATSVMLYEEMTGIVREKSSGN